MKFGGLTKLTLLDYPEKVACTVFTTGCNFRCPFCHNAGLVCGSNGETVSEEEILDFLARRKTVLEGVCLTGGEPLLQHGVEDFLRKVKALHYSVKLDTNGSFPDKLSSLISAGLIDYVAMDVKNSRTAYAETAGCGNLNVDAICRSVDLLKGGIVPYEFRTTVTGNYHTEESIEEMGKWLQGNSKLYLQKFVNSGDLIDGSTVGCSDDTLRRYQSILQKYLPNTFLRGVDA